ncbi:MAG: GNAT family N-acetyltransferase [Stomatobaculum sp.]|nr:GNAT family N-acetyltransferase [Stomatobaculum sp.]
MKYTEQNKLTKAQQEQVKTLLEKCREKEAFTLSFPMHEPQVKYFLAEEEDGQVRGALALCRFSPSEYEMLAFTDPDLRNQGIFRKLWDTAKMTLPMNTEDRIQVRAAVDEACLDAAAVLKALHARFRSEEMEMRGSTETASAGAGSEYAFRKTAKPDQDGAICYEAADKTTRESVFRSYIIPYSPERCFVLRVAVRKGLEGKGIGSLVFPEFMRVLLKEGYQTVTLQVSGANEAAVKLYEKAGFETTRSLKYYEIPLK